MKSDRTLGEILGNEAKIFCFGQCLLTSKIQDTSSDELRYLDCRKGHPIKNRNQIDFSKKWLTA
jgi:hypothetical protein